VELLIQPQELEKGCGEDKLRQRVQGLDGRGEAEGAGGDQEDG
jgi:hypothetical protein